MHWVTWLRDWRWAWPWYRRYFPSLTILSLWNESSWYRWSNDLWSKWTKPAFSVDIISGDRVRWTGRFNAAVWPLQCVRWQFRLHNFWYLSRSQYWPNRIDFFADVHIREVSCSTSSRKHDSFGTCGREWTILIGWHSSWIHVHGGEQLGPWLIRFNDGWKDAFILWNAIIVGIHVGFYQSEQFVPLTSFELR